MQVMHYNSKLVQRVHQTYGFKMCASPHVGVLSHKMMHSPLHQDLLLLLSSQYSLCFTEFYTSKVCFIGLIYIMIAGHKVETQCWNAYKCKKEQVRKARLYPALISKPPPLFVERERERERELWRRRRSHLVPV